MSSKKNWVKWTIIIFSISYIFISLIKVMVHKSKEEGERAEFRRTIQGFYDINSTVGSSLWARYDRSNKAILRIKDDDYGVVCYIAEARYSYYSLSCVKINQQEEKSWN